jgi:hypothetical protein
MPIPIISHKNVRNTGSATIVEPKPVTRKAAQQQKLVIVNGFKNCFLNKLLIRNNTLNWRPNKRIPPINPISNNTIHQNISV